MSFSTTHHQAYFLSLAPLFKAVEAGKGNGRQDLSLLANDLIHGAIAYDQSLLAASLARPYDGKVARNFKSPILYASASVLCQPWSDHAHGLPDDEAWNEGRRITNTGLAYAIGADGLPVNPYGDYGVRGQGIIGLHGPNHAVDIGALRCMKNAEGRYALHALGIVRQDNGHAALCGGFTQFTKSPEGLYVYDEAVKIDSQTAEFFEEMVSGSVELMPAYAAGLDEEIAEEVRAREVIEGPLSDKKRRSIEAQLATHRKVLQVGREDPAFFDRVRDMFREAIPCYEGPVRSSSRNTNSSWMETRLSFCELDEAKWQWLVGENKFGYRLAAGDDAAQVLCHEITPALMEKSGSHAALFTFLFSGYLMTAGQPPEILADLKVQAGRLQTFFADKSGVKPAFVA